MTCVVMLHNTRTMQVYHIANKHRGQNQEKLSQNITRLADFLSSNQLTINKETRAHRQRRTHGLQYSLTPFILDFFWGGGVIFFLGVFFFFFFFFTVQYCTVQYNTVTVQYSTVQYSTVQYSTVQYSTVQ